MSKRLLSATFTITEKQLAWIKEQQQKTGLTQVEIVRRALDEYAEREETKEHRKLFTPQQRQEISRFGLKVIITSIIGLNTMDRIVKALLPTTAMGACTKTSM